MPSPSPQRGLEPQRVVAIVATFGPTSIKVGSGYLATNAHVLTAHHCVADLNHGRAAQSLVVVLPDSRRIAANLIARCDDIAVLSIDSAAVESLQAISAPPTYASVDRQLTGELRNCEALGYPTWQTGKENKRHIAEVRGVIRIAEGIETGTLVLRDALLDDVTSPTRAETRRGESPWSGLSGALVFYDGLALGVIIEHHLNQGRSALTIVPLDKIAAQAETGSPDAGATARALVLPRVHDLALVGAELSIDQQILLDNARDRTRTWCDDILSRSKPDFWQQTWRSYLDPQTMRARPDSFVLTGRAGSGKTVLAAHIVSYLLDLGRQGQRQGHGNPAGITTPILIRTHDIDEGFSAVCRLAGVASGDELKRLARYLRTAGRPLIFIVDGLDAVKGSAHRGAILRTLEETIRIAQTLITCRSEPWEESFSALSVHQLRVRPLSLQSIIDLLDKSSLRNRPSAATMAVLRIPFYTDVALRLSSQVMTLPETETGLLSALWRTYRDDPGGAHPRPNNLAIVLTKLAELQFAEMYFEIDRTALLEHLADVMDGGHAVQALEDTGILARRASGSTTVVRLNHDLLDCFNMIQLLIGDERSSQREIAYERIANGIGWHVISLLAQFAYDNSIDRLLNEIFSWLLRILDRKRFGEEWMQRSWAATYVLRNNVMIFLPLILECLDGAEADSLATVADTGGSTGGPRAMITQESASSLASSFSAIRDWQSAIPDRAIPVLGRGLERWTLRKRFIEALARYKDSSALAVIVTFAGTQLQGQGDLPLMTDLADAIGAVARELGPEDRQLAIATLDQIADHRDMNQRSRRAAMANKHALTGAEYAESVSEEEIIAFLDPVDRDRNSYSDWSVIQRYSTFAYERITSGRLTDALFDGLLKAMTHEHTEARIYVARCLGMCDRVEARSALLEELIKSYPGSGLQKACLDAFRVQIESSPNPTVNALRRWMLLSVASDSSLATPRTALIIKDLVTQLPGNRACCVTDSAFEIVPSSPPGTPSYSFVTALADNAPPTSQWIRDIVEREDYERAGEGWENKYRLAAVKQISSSVICADITPTSWEEGAAFHSSMLRKPHELRERADRILSSWLAGNASIPGIFSVHCIIVTRDDKVVAARRSSNSFYSANRWSFSFEEQVTAADVSADHDIAVAAALRGFAEEFSQSPDTCNARVVSAIVEFAITNPVVVVLLRTSLLSVDIEAGISELGDASKAEIAQVRFVDFAIDALDAEATRSDLHPTAGIRLEILSRQLGR